MTIPPEPIYVGKRYGIIPGTTVWLRPIPLIGGLIPIQWREDQNLHGSGFFKVEKLMLFDDEDLIKRPLNYIEEYDPHIYFHFNLPANEYGFTRLMVRRRDVFVDRHEPAQI
jgi:hypothetical protein